MAKKKKVAKIVVNGIDLTPVFKDVSVSIDRDLRGHFAKTRKALNQLERVRKSFDGAMKGLEAQDKLGNFEIQSLMSDYNQMETLASNVSKKVDRTMGCVISKI